MKCHKKLIVVVNFTSLWLYSNGLSSGMGQILDKKDKQLRAVL